MTSEFRSGSEIARLAHRSHPTAIKILKRLADQGVVESIESGRSTLYTLNRNHLAADPIIELATLRSTLFERLREQVQSWAVPPVSVTVFGSAARGDGDESSDIDLLVVRPETVDPGSDAWIEGLARLRRLTYRWTGNHLASIEIGEDEVPEMHRNDSSFYDNVKRDGIHIAGRRFSRLSPFEA